MKGKMKHKEHEKHEKKEAYKKGGHVKAHEEKEESKEKKAHKAHGKHPKKRLDKFKRGGVVGTPSSPLSGAEPKELPGGGKGQNKPSDKMND